MTTTELLTSLGVLQEQPAGSLPSTAGIGTVATGVLESRNPSNGRVLGRVYGCSDDDYQGLVDGLCERQLSWRQVPAPKRGEVIRLIGQALREHKDALGTLV